MHAESQPYDEYMTESEYLAFETESEFKHEYANGRIYALAGGTEDHNAISVNTSTIIKSQLFGQDCKVYSSDQAVKVSSKSVSYRYPDVSLVCGDRDFADDKTRQLLNPTILIEVLSPTTTVTDYREKIAEYTSIPSLQAYLIISQDEARIEMLSRQGKNDWRYQNFTGIDKVIELPSINCTLDLERVYDGIAFDDE